MVTLQQIILFLNKELAIHSIMDDSRNGLQVKGRNKVRRVAVGVDACMEFFENAKQLKCDLVLVHHGLLWKGKKDTVGITKNRILFLRKNKISLYACHLPLDKHPVYGNNAQLAKIISLKNIHPFGKYNKKNIGFSGNLKIRVDDLIWKLEHCLKTKCICHLFGPKMTKKIGIVSGGAADMMGACKKLDIDTYITGETRHSYYHIAHELRINVIYAGHYKTETVGVRAVGELLRQKFNIETIFIDTPTGL